MDVALTRQDWTVFEQALVCRSNIVQSLCESCMNARQRPHQAPGGPKFENSAQIGSDGGESPRGGWNRGGGVLPGFQDFLRISCWGWTVGLQHLYVHENPEILVPPPPDLGGKPTLRALARVPGF